jgi:hypothetical protein
LCYCVVSFVGDPDVRVFEEICYFPYCWFIVGTQQQLSQQINNKTKTTNGTEHKKTTTRQEREHKQKMGKLYLL